MFIRQFQTNVPIVFQLVGSSDHITPLTGATPTVTIAKNGTGFMPPSGSVQEIGNGWYGLWPKQNDTGIQGSLVLHATATSADPADALFWVVDASQQAGIAGAVVQASGINLSKNVQGSS